jgi:hypothetical protein
MKTAAMVILPLTVVSIISGMASSAFAAAGGREDHSSLVVWTFLGFCALIVIVQLLPSLRDARLAARKEQEAREQENAVKVPVNE